MVSIKAFFAEHNAILAANVPRKAENINKSYHVVVETPEIIEKPNMAPKKPFNFWAPWVAKTKPLPPMTEREIANQRAFENDHEMDAFNLWAPWAAKCKVLPPMTEREQENLNNKSWTVERRA